MSRLPEYTWCVDSNNREKNSEDPANPTNNITIDTMMPRARLPATFMSLGSAELPMSQYLIESLWNKLYFTEGLSLIGNTLSSENIRTFSVEVNGVTTTAVLPLYLNAIVAVDLTDPTAPIFTTEFDHALEMRGQWNWGAPLELISTPLSGALVQFTTDNAHLTILDEQRFQLSGAPAVAYPNPGGIYGYLYAPPIPSPDYLAHIVQAALNYVLPGQFKITYNIETGCFCFQSLATVTDTCVSNPGFASPIVNIRAIPNTLPSLMGFGCAAVIPVPVPPTGDCKKATDCAPYVLCGQSGQQCFGYVSISEGNYTPDGLASQLNLQWSRFYFDPASGVPVVFVYSDPTGVAHSIAVPYGLYTPETLSETLTNGMNAIDPAFVYEVLWDSAHAQFKIYSLSNLTFGLEFNNVLNTFNPLILGFDAVAYRGATTYTSTFEVQVPLTSCCVSSSIPPRYPSFVYQVRCNLNQRKFIINVNKPVCVSSAQATTVGGVLSIVSATIAHGYQCEDVITLRVTATQETYLLRVVAVTDAFTFDVDVGSVGALVGLVNEPVSTCLAGLIVSNLLWSDGKRAQSLPPRVMGFPAADVLFQAQIPQPPFISQFCFDLNPPGYVLLVIRTPYGATNVSHAWRQSNIPNVFAKIVLYPEYTLQRIYPMSMNLPQVDQITKVKFEFLNPDHTPYQFHGKEWSATLVFLVPEATSTLNCY